MRRKVIGAIFCCCVLLLECTSGGTQTQEKVPGLPPNQSEQLTPDALLVRSYLIGKQFVAEERAFQLARLSETAVTVQPPLGRLWAEELFHLAFELPMSWNRVAHEKNAVSALARVDAIRAFELFRTMDATVPTPSGQLPEDLRAFGARRVFDALWKHTGVASLEEIRLQAQHLGATGQYPYLAVSPILKDVAKFDEMRAHSLFEEALTYYTRGSRFRATHGEFVRFLESVWDVVPESMKLQALRVVIGNLTRELEAPEGETFGARVQSDKGMAELRSRSAHLLYSLLPRVRELDREWADRLVKSNPFVGQAEATTGSRASSEEVTIEDTQNASPAEVRRLEDMGLQASRLSRIRALAANNPEEALVLALSLTIPAYRAIAFAIISGEVSHADAKRAAELLKQAKLEMQTIQQDDAGKVSALVALATAAAVAKDTKELREFLSRGFDLGEEVFQQDADMHPGKLILEVAAFEELGRLTRLGISVDREHTLARILNMGNSLLQAHLLVDAAEALHDLSQRQSN